MNAQRLRTLKSELQHSEISIKVFSVHLFSGSFMIRFLKNNPQSAVEIIVDKKLTDSTDFGQESPEN